jgi:hypothetical protein
MSAPSRENQKSPKIRCRIVTSKSIEKARRARQPKIHARAGFSAPDCGLNSQRFKNDRDLQHRIIIVETF